MRKKKEPSSVAVLVRIPAFRRLWIAISVSSFGDWLGLLATTSLAAYLTKESSGLAQGAAVSAVLLTRLLPDLILGPVAGALVDKFDRRLVAIVGDTLAGLLYLSIAVVGNLTWLLLAQFLVEAVGLFSNPAKQAMWVNIVPRERLAVANQLNYVSIYGMVPVAAAVFALLSTVAQFFGATEAAGTEGGSALITGPTSSAAIDVALAIDAATYFFCAATVLFSRHLIPAFVGERSTGKSIFSLIAEGVSFVRHSRIMRALYIGILGAFGAGGLTAGVAQAYVSALGAGSAGYGILFGAVFTGLALGMLTGPRVLPTVPRRMIFTSSIGGAGTTLLIMSTLQDFLGAAIVSTIMGWFAGIAWITGFTMIGHEVSDQLRGRVFAFVMSSVRLTLLATIALGPVIAGTIGALRIRIGDFRWDLSSAAIVLAAGGIIALLVTVYCGRQVGGLVFELVRRVARRRRKDMFVPTSYSGALIAIEGADPVALAAMTATTAEHLSGQGWRVSAFTLDAGGGTAETPADALRAGADLAELVSKSVLPELRAGAVVLCTGFIDSVVVRFGAVAGLGEEHLMRTISWAIDGLQPDLTILVDGGEPVTVDPAGSENPAGSVDPADTVDLAESGRTTDEHAGSVGEFGPAEVVDLIEPLLIDPEPVEQVEPAAPDSEPVEQVDPAAPDPTVEPREPAGTRVTRAPDGPGRPADSADDLPWSAVDEAAEPEEPVDPVVAYRDLASSAPERYLVIAPETPVHDLLTGEVQERIASILRQRSPQPADSFTSGPVPASWAGHPAGGAEIPDGAEVAIRT